MYIKKCLVNGHILFGAVKVQQLPTPFHHFKPTQSWNPKEALQAQETSEVTVTQNVGIVVFPVLSPSGCRGCESCPG